MDEEAARDVGGGEAPGGGLEALDEIDEGKHPEIRQALSADRVVALVGQASFADGPKLAESVAAYVRNKAGSARILPLARRGNLFGALDMALAPDLLPGRVAAEDAGWAALGDAWGEPPASRGRDTRAMLEGLDSGDIRFLLLVGSDPVHDVPDPRQAVQALDSAEYVVSIDLFVNDSNREADVILPAAGFAEKEGTVTNIEGRVQKVNAIAPIPGQARPEWAILDDLAERAGRALGLATAESIAKEISEVAPAYSGVTWDHLEWEARDGAVVPMSGAPQLSHIPVALKGDSAPSAPLLLHVGRTLYDDGVMLRHTPMLRPLAPGPVAYLNPEDAKRAGAQNGHPVKVVTSHGEGEFSAVLDEGTPEGVVYVPFNQPGGAPLGTDAVVRVTAVGR